MFKTVNLINSIPFHKTNPLSFEGKGHITLEKGDLDKERILKLCQELAEKAGDGKKRILKAVEAERILRNEGKLYLIKKVIIEDGDEEIPDDINYPDAEIVMTGGEVKTIKGSNIELKNNVKVENVEAKNIATKNSSTITGNAKASGQITMLDNSKAKNVETRTLNMQNKAEITGRANVSGSAILSYMASQEY